MRFFQNPSQFVQVKNLPDTLIAALKSIGYNKKDIQIFSSTTYQANAGAGGDGSRGFVLAVDLISGASKLTMGSWGGANMFERKQVDADDAVYMLPVNGAVVKGSQGNGIYASLIVHPDNLPRMLPSGAEEELSAKEIKAIVIIAGIKSGARREYFASARLGAYSPTNPVIMSLAAKGLLKLTGVGISITTEGRNVAASHPEVNAW